jgi:integrase
MGDKTRLVVAKHLQRIGTIYSAAVKEPTSVFAGAINPVMGVSVLGKAPIPRDGADKVFSPEQMRTIFATAKIIKFGYKRREAMMWILELLAYTGCRPNEVFQLMGGDVCEENGIRYLKIQGIDPTTGKPHPQKSVKTGGPRIVPLHPEVEGFYEYAKKVEIMSLFSKNSNGIVIMVERLI